MCENPSGRGNVGVKFTGGVALDEEEIYESGRRQGRVEGAAVAFGIMGMAEAIRQRPGLKACPLCLKASYGWVGIGKDAICIDCSNNGQRASRPTGHPYR